MKLNFKKLLALLFSLNISCTTLVQATFEEEVFALETLSQHVKLSDRLMSQIVYLSQDVNLAKDIKVVNRIAMLVRQHKFTSLFKDNGFEKTEVLKSPTVWKKLVENLHPNDDLKRVVAILQELKDLDQKNFARFFNLALATALVWDKPPAQIHSQMGPVPGYKLVDYKTIYTALKSKYSERKHYSFYLKLKVSDLVYVVHIPLVENDFRRIYDNTRGSDAVASYYSSIEYSQNRILKNEYTWPVRHGDYSLHNIKTYGGICVDQAYYALMVARKHGIPSIYFSGTGRDGGHAWVGHLSTPGDWVTDVGKYSQGNYTIGYMVHPQTGERVSDKALELLCDRKYQTRIYKEMEKFIVIAQFLLSSQELKQSEKFIDFVISRSSLHEEAWRVKEKIIAQTVDPQKIGLVEFYNKKLQRFRKTLDIYALEHHKLSDLYVQLGEEKQALKLYKKSIRVYGDDRVDLVWKATQNQFSFYELTSENKKAKDILEEFIEDNSAEGFLISEALSTYVTFCKKNQFEKECCHFMEKIYSKMIVATELEDKAQLMNLMERVYALDNDKRGLKKLAKEREDLKKKQTEILEKSQKAELKRMKKINRRK